MNAPKFFCYRVDSKELTVRQREYVGIFPEAGGEVHGIGGMEGIANETTFLLRKNADRALTASIRRQLGHHVRRMTALLRVLKAMGEAQ